MTDFRNEKVEGSTPFSGTNSSRASGKQEADLRVGFFVSASFLTSIVKTASLV